VVIFANCVVADYGGAHHPPRVSTLSGQRAPRTPKMLDEPQGWRASKRDERVLAAGQTSRSLLSRSLDSTGMDTTGTDASTSSNFSIRVW
jgi:hypothetical protein